MSPKEKGKCFWNCKQQELMRFANMGDSGREVVGRKNPISLDSCPLVIPVPGRPNAQCEPFTAARAGILVLVRGERSGLWLLHCLSRCWNQWWRGNLNSQGLGSHCSHSHVQVASQGWQPHPSLFRGPVKGVVLTQRTCLWECCLICSRIWFLPYSVYHNMLLFIRRSVVICVDVNSSKNNISKFCLFNVGNSSEL